MTMTDAPRTALEAAIDVGLEETREAVTLGQPIRDAVRAGYERTIRHLITQAGLDPLNMILRYYDAAVEASESAYLDKE